MAKRQEAYAVKTDGVEEDARMTDIQSCRVESDIDNLLEPVDIYMTPSFVNGIATKSMPLRVFNGMKEDPKLISKEKRDDYSLVQDDSYYYEEFDEKNGYKNKKQKNDKLKPSQYQHQHPFDDEEKTIRNVQRKDGMIYLYSKHKALSSEIQEKTIKMAKVNQIQQEPKASIQQQYVHSEAIQMLICLTMYAEPKDFLINTLKGIYKNLKGFKEMGISPKQIAVVILQDGIMKMKEETVDFYSEWDIKKNRQLKLVSRRQVIQQQIDYLKRNNRQSALDYNDGLPNTIPKQIALLYQDLLEFDLNENKSSTKNKSGSNIEKRDQLTTFSVFKHLNGKKLSSHLWFFEGFCRQFQPKYCALVDVGTVPDAYGLVNMFRALEGNSRIGGVCGFMGLKSPEENKTNEQLEEVVKNQKKKEIESVQENHYWIKADQEKKNNEDKLKKVQTQHIQSQYAIRSQYNEQKLDEIKEKKKKTDLKLMCILNVFFLVGALLTFLYEGILWFCRKAFYLCAYILRVFFNFASLPHAQNYEYTTAHMIDKNFESALGFLHVLPGAWSAYRYEAINISKEHRENLIQKRYLKQILSKELLSNTIQELNMFLAEDRILCLGIFCQLEQNYLLKFIPDAKAFTDPVDNFEDFLNQRRRWINSSWFALNYVLQNYEYHVEESSHSFLMKKIIFPMNMFFAEVGKFNTYFIPAFYLFVAIICSFQFLQPLTSTQYKLINDSTAFSNRSSLKCDSLTNFPSNTFQCETNPTFPCYVHCSANSLSVAFFTILNIIPAILVVLIIMIIFASLTFKPKTVEIKPEETVELKKLKEDQEKGKVLTNDEKKRKMNLQNKHSQQFQNNVFRTLAALISLISLVIFLIVLVTIILNIFEIKMGFEQTLSDNFRIYLVVMLIANYGTFYLSMIVHLLFQPFIVWNVIKSFISYWIYAPIYNYILLIFSFCNIDDVTWGTKGLTDGKQNDKLKNEKIKFVGIWILSNTFVLTVLMVANSLSTNTPYVVMILGGYGTVYSLIKTIIGTLHYLKYFLFDKLINCFLIKKNKKDYILAQQSIEEVFKEKIKTLSDQKSKYVQDKSQYMVAKSQYLAQSQLGVPSQQQPLQQTSTFQFYEEAESLEDENENKEDLLDSVYLGIQEVDEEQEDADDDDNDQSQLNLCFNCKKSKVNNDFDDHDKDQQKRKDHRAAQELVGNNDHKLGTFGHQMTFDLMQQQMHQQLQQDSTKKNGQMNQQNKEINIGIQNHFGGDNHGAIMEKMRQQRNQEFQLEENKKKEQMLQEKKPNQNDHNFLEERKQHVPKMVEFTDLKDKK